MESIMSLSRVKCLVTAFLFCLLTLPGLVQASECQPGNAVALLYHHVADDTPASTSIAPQQFAEHMAYLATHHNVLPLTDVISALKQGKSLPANTVVITFDDGYENIYRNAHPVLQRYGFPYTIFINPDVIGTTASQLSWEQVNEMQSEGAAFANHTLEHLHMLEMKPGESQQAWLNRVWKNVSEAESVLQRKTGQSLKYLAYPYGEFNSALMQRVSEEGYVGFGQHSGAMGPQSNFAALPRFPAAGPYARLESLKNKLTSLAMPVTPDSGLRPEREKRRLNTPLTLTMTSDDVLLSQAACYYQGDAVDTAVKGKTLVATLNMTLPVGRSRINCTAPSKQHTDRYYWYSQPFFIADENGRYPD